MTGQGRSLRQVTAFPVLLAVLVLCAPTIATAVEPASLPTLRSSTERGTSAPRGIPEDATLRDIQFIGTQVGFAVGDHGLVLKTTDGGNSWQQLTVPVDCTLRSICFLSDRVGWIVGGDWLTYTRIGTGVLLHTNDGGSTWQQLAREELPELHRVRFFSLESGYVIGRPNAAYPSGVMQTTDGGRTWRPLAGAAASGWRTADFLRPDVGVVAGDRGRMALVANGRLNAPRTDEPSLKGFYAIDLVEEGRGWLVGDGGLALQTSNGGLVWKDPPQPLPTAARDVFDFRAVHARGDRVWIAGRPGSTIWHSPDGGQTWERQRTGEPQPLEALTFTSENDGWAVGTLGTMLRTRDGGRTWQAVRGGGRRAAYLVLHAHPDQVSVNLVAKLSGESGYRGIVALLPRRDVGPEAESAYDYSSRLEEAVVSTGGSATEIAWQFPLAAPQLEQDFTRMIADWNRRTEGRLTETLLGHLVATLRTWRPSVLILNQPQPNDAASRVLHDAMLVAVEQAADPTRYLDQRELGGLQPWRVEKVYARLPLGSSGQAEINPDEFLPRLGRSVAAASAGAASLLSTHLEALPQREGYRLVRHQVENALAGQTGGDFFLGLNLPPGSPARRPLLPMSDGDIQSQIDIAHRQRNFRAYADRYLADPRHAAQLVAQLRDVVSGMPPDQAALQLAQLAEAYRKTGEWELAESTMFELVERYPREAPARDAMRWLLQLWTSTEVAWRRTQVPGTTVQRTTTDREQLLARFLNASAAKEDGTSDGTTTEGVRPAVGSTFQTVTGSGEVKLTGRDSKSQAIDGWHERATRIAELLQRTTPALARTPEVQFPLAALHRQRRRTTEVNEIYHNLLRHGGEGPWQLSARAELWIKNPAGLPPKPLHLCRRTTTRPLLDGLLSDACWQNADELTLTPGRGTGSSDAHSFVMLSYDDEYLYFAGSFSRVPDTPPDSPQLTGREHDADLSAFDRVTLVLDVDRDYATYYRFSIDQRGWTAEDCWEDSSWNPQWFVAADGDAAAWRIEVAIPLAALAPQAPRSNSVWGATIVRTIPAVGLQSWTHPASTVPRLETGGLLRFD